MLARSVLAISHGTGIRLAEIGYLLIAFAGVWFAAAEIPLFKMASKRRFVAGLALAAAGALLIIATHWGHFG
jgi:hypothetical protein